MMGVSPREPLLKPTPRIKYMFRKLVNQPDSTFTPYYIVCVSETLGSAHLSLSRLEDVLGYGSTDAFRNKITSIFIKDGVEDGQTVSYYAVGNM